MPKKLLAMLTLLALVLPIQLAHGQEQGTVANGSAATEGTKPGLLSFDPQQAIWVLAIFLVLVLVLYRTAWKNVLAGLKKREERIRKDIADAEAARVKAEASLREYTQRLADTDAKVQVILAKAASDAEKVGQSLRMQAQTDAEEIKERANREIEASKNQAIREIYEQAANLSTSIAEKILRRNLNVDDQRDLVTRSLEQMQEIGKN